MILAVALGLAAALSAPPPLIVEVSPVRGALEVRVQLEDSLPTAFTDTLPSGALVRVTYPVRVRSRRWLLWDGRVWKGQITSQAAFDPITDRYRCELLLDEVVVESAEMETAELALDWLRAPPPVRLVFEDPKNLDRLYVRARAVFSSTTMLLVFPNNDGTDWVSAPVIINEPEAAPALE